MGRLPTSGLVTAAVLLVADQLAKLGVTHGLRLDEMSDALAVTPFFNLRFVANHGVSLGLLHADDNMTRWALVALTAAISLGVAVWMFRERVTQDRIALGLILGGALGNIADRVRLGYVVDFADLHFWAPWDPNWRPFLVFNVADAAITIGVLVLLVRAFLMRDKRAAPLETPHA